MNKKKWKITEKAQRPGGRKGRCFYCGKTVGSFHKSDCVLIKKTVKVKLTINYEVNVPADWDKQMIEFHRNDSTWCSSNLIEELKKLDTKNGCLCPIAEFKYLETTGEPKLDE